MSLFTFHNEFDDVDVVLDDESPVIDKHGPYSISVVFNDRAISTDNTTETFPTLRAAYERFTELVKNEILAVLDDGTFK